MGAPLPAEPAVPSGQTIRQQVIAEARSWIGTPYRHQASRKGAGCDCLGLLRGIWRALYGSEPQKIPPYTADWAEAGGAETLLAAGRRWLKECEPNAALPGDVLLFRWRDGAPAKHVGILSSPTLIIHAYERVGVVEMPLAAAWRRRIAASFSFPDGAR